MLTDWTDEDPRHVFGRLKKQSDYYNIRQRTLGDLVRDAKRDGLGATLAERLAWATMRMNPTDLADVGGATYTYLMNGQPPAGNWTGLFTPGERVRLRLINGSAMSYFDVRIPGVKLTVVAADGLPVRPVTVDELRIAVAETYDVIVEPSGAEAFTIVAQAMDRTGFAAGTLAARAGLRAEVPAPDPRPVLTMADMGHAHESEHDPDHADHGAAPQDPHAGHAAGGAPAQRVAQPARRHADHGAARQAGRSRHRAARQRAARADLRRPVERLRGSRRPGAVTDDRAAPDRPHGALRLVVRRRAVRGRGAAAAHLRRARASGARQRHDDDAPDPPARDVERSRGRAGPLQGAQAHDRHAARIAAVVPRDGGRARPLGVSLPPALPHGSRHVPRGARRGRRRARDGGTRLRDPPARRRADRVRARRGGGARPGAAADAAGSARGPRTAGAGHPGRARTGSAGRGTAGAAAVHPARHRRGSRRRLPRRRRAHGP